MGSECGWMDGWVWCVCTYVSVRSLTWLADYLHRSVQKSVGQRCLLETFPCGLQSTRNEESFYTCFVMCRVEDASVCSKRLDAAPNCCLP